MKNLFSILEPIAPSPSSSRSFLPRLLIHFDHFSFFFFFSLESSRAKFFFLPRGEGKFEYEASSDEKRKLTRSRGWTVRTQRDETGLRVGEERREKREGMGEGGGSSSTP